MQIKQSRILCLVSLGVIMGASLFSADTPAPYEVVHGWPRLPEGLALGQVAGVGVDTHNHVWIFHRGEHPIMCFEASTGKLLHSFGDGMFGQPHGLSVDLVDAEDINVWVTDVELHQVFKFSHEGELRMTLGEKGVAGLSATQFNGPTDVEVTRDGEIYVADGYGNNRVVKFAPDGTFLLDWGQKGDQPGEFDLPHGIALDGRGRIYVADRGNSRIQIFDANGKFLQQWQSPDLGRPWGLEVARRNVFVVDGGDLKPKPPDRGRVLKLDLRGNVLGEFGSFGRYDGQFYWAHDVAVGDNGDVYVVDVHLGMRVQKFVRR